MKICFLGWKKIADDTDRLSSFGSTLACGLLFAGALAFFAESPQRDSNKLQSADATDVPTRLSVRLEHFIVPVTTAERENAPEEIPTSLPTAPQPKASTEQAPPPKIEENAVRETTAANPTNETNPLEAHDSEQEAIEETASPDRNSAPASETLPATEEASLIDSATRIAAEQSLYGALTGAVSRKKFYPRAARRTGRTGIIRMQVVVGTCGKIKNFRVENTSAHQLLISGAEETLRRVADEFRAPEATHACLPASFVVPIVYELK